MPALLHLNALGPLTAQDLEHGWALLGSTLLLRHDYSGPVFVAIPQYAQAFGNTIFSRSSSMSEPIYIEPVLRPLSSFARIIKCTRLYLVRF
jgi:hypothetical protein